MTFAEQRHNIKESAISMSQGANETFDNSQISGQNFCEAVNFNVMSQMCQWFIANFPPMKPQIRNVVKDKMPSTKNVASV